MVGPVEGRRYIQQDPRRYAYLLHAVDSYSRVMYCETPHDERQETAAGFWLRANPFFASSGVTVSAVMTDNGSCSVSRICAAALGLTFRHRSTPPYRPQPHGKIERFNRTLLAECTYTTTYLRDAARAITYLPWMHWYNHHRHHTGIGGHIPVQHVHNLDDNYT